MAQRSNIEWTDYSWNPVTGCSKVSEGCRHCYAERMAKRLKAMGNARYADGFNVTLQDDLVDLPRRLRKPRIIFVNSMSDLFHDAILDEHIGKIAKVMSDVRRHTYQVLTKRSVRMKDLLNGDLRDCAACKHIWWGVSAENREYGLPRMDVLRETNCQNRFVSIEPLLSDIGKLNLDGIHWVIVGGESGPKARPMKQEWVVSIRDQCKQANVPFFFKQWGGVHKKQTGRLLDGVEWNERPIRMQWGYTEDSYGPLATNKERRS